MKQTVSFILFSLFLIQPVFCQLCTGSLGDPIVNITFGANSPGPLPFGITSMTYTAGDCPQDGSYTIRGNSTGCFNGTWFDVTADHTGDKGGQFMLINASFNPSDFYVNTVSGLCGNTTYEFAAWVMNILKGSACSGNIGGGIKPNLTFRIETTSGVVLVKYDSGDIPSAGFAQWRQYGTFFKTPAGVTDLVLRITNNAPGGCGNDLALDDITFRPCGPLVTASIRNQAATSVNFCESNPQSFILDANSTSAFAGETMQWQVSVDSGKVWTDIAGAQSTSYTRKPTTAGVYQYRIVSADAANFSSTQCRVASGIITVTVDPTPAFTPKNFVLGCTSADVQFITAQGTGYTYQWSGPNNFSSSIYDPLLPNVSYTDSGLYRAIVTIAQGCTATDTFNLKVFQGVNAKVNADTRICQGSSVALLASGGVTYSWSPAAGLSNPQISNPIATPTDTTVYTVTVGNQFGCTDTVHTTVVVYKNPVVSAGPDKKIFEGQTVTLDGSITGDAISFFWSPVTAMSNPNILNPTVSPTDSITYTLYVLPGSGCPLVADNVFVYVYKNVFVPNAFSPNGDGINDTWIIKGLETYPDAVLHVYTRTGQLIFQSKANDHAWDGTFHDQPVPVATYYYVIDLKLNLAPLSGWVVVLR